jgi:hypothetical protein
VRGMPQSSATWCGSRCFAPPRGCHRLGGWSRSGNRRRSNGAVAAEQEPGAFKVTRQAVFESDLPGISRMVMLVLVDHLPNVCPSVARIVERSGFGRTAVLAALKQLESAGWISVDRRNGGRSTYQLVRHADRSATRTGTPDAPPPVRVADHTSPPDVPLPVRHADPKPSTKPPSKPAREAKPAPPLPTPVVEPVGSQTIRPVFRDLDNWTPPDWLVDEAAMQGIPRKVFHERLAQLRNGPIGGVRGVFNREDYVRDQFPKWRTWQSAASFSEHQRQRGRERGAEAPEQFKSDREIWFARRLKAIAANDREAIREAEAKLRELDAGGAGETTGGRGHAAGRAGGAPGERAARVG